MSKEFGKGGKGGGRDDDWDHKPAALPTRAGGGASDDRSVATPAQDASHAGHRAGIFEPLSAAWELARGERGPADVYAARQGAALLGALTEALAAAELPLAPGARWAQGWHGFVRALPSAVAADGELYQQLPRWLAGVTDVWALLDQHRPLVTARDEGGRMAQGPVSQYYPATGQALARRGGRRAGTALCGPCRARSPQMANCINSCRAGSRA